jgi:hypothetical protein
MISGRQLGVLSLAFLALLLGSIGCGRRAAPRPPEDVAPQTITDLRAAKTTRGIQLAWSRPRNYVDGSRMPDLGGFVIERTRGTPALGPFERLTVVEVTDQLRFQRSKRFLYVDEQVKAETEYRYRVVSFTLDGYFSEPSNIASAKSGQHEGGSAPTAGDPGSSQPPSP